MPLDMGAGFSETRTATDVEHTSAPPSAVSLHEAASLGQALAAVRLASGRTLAEMSQATRVHQRYLKALEEDDHAVLPAPAFALGYLRAYAAALGLDEQAAADRFRAEGPSAPTSLQAPTGADVADARRGSPRLIAAVAALVLAVVGWNVYQRVNLVRQPAPSAIAETPETWSLGSAPGVVSLGAPRAAPPDQTTPALYVTPGLEAQLASAAAAVPGAAGAAPPVQAAFNPRGATYGVSPTAGAVVIQAQRAASIVVRMADGRVLFARQLAAGEAWRAPSDAAATVDVSEPTAFTLYLNGEYGGALAATLTPLAQLNNRARALARDRQP